MSQQDHAKATIFLHHHIYEGLRSEYLTVIDPLELWKHSEEQFDHHKSIVIPIAQHDWTHMQLQY